MKLGNSLNNFLVQRKNATGKATIIYVRNIKKKFVKSILKGIIVHFTSIFIFYI